MSDTSMIRIDNNLKTKFKELAKSEGRTLEYMVNHVIQQYLVDTIYKEHNENVVLRETIPFDEPTYTTIEETA